MYSLCCQCGTAIEPNPANMCVACLRTQIDITEGIPKQSNIYFCKSCERSVDTLPQATATELGHNASGNI